LSIIVRANSNANAVKSLDLNFSLSIILPGVEMRTVKNVLAIGFEVDTSYTEGSVKRVGLRDTECFV